MKILGIDNIFLSVGNLEAAVAHYQQLGLTLRFTIAQTRMAIFSIGEEEPGLILREEAPAGQRVGPSPILAWLEVRDAKGFAAELTAKGIKTVGEPFETATGFTVEARDPWGGGLGFADYVKRPDMARKDG